MTVAIMQRPAERAKAVQEQLEATRRNLASNALLMGDLLSEIKHNSYHEHYGCSSFSDWLYNSSSLDMSERTAYYLINIVDTAKQLGIPRKQLEAVKMSKLKEIFTLNPETNGDDIKQLVAAGDAASLEETKNAVVKAKVGDEQFERAVWLNIKLLESQREVVKEAIERAKRSCGDTIDPRTGEVAEPSDARALELIAADYLAQPDQMQHELDQMAEE